MEQEEYAKEEINWSYIEFDDNQDILDLIEKKPGGIIALLDEACMFPKSTHETFAQKLYQTFKNNKRFLKPKLSSTDFTLCHYAGEVKYQADQFLDKNKDYVVAEHQELLMASKCPFVAGLISPAPEESSKSSKFSSIGARFKLGLQSLVDTLNTTQPQYIRCLKPNNIMKPGLFENFNVIQQLRSGGVLDAIRISCAGYPTRQIFNDFLNRFGLLASEEFEGRYSEMVACKMILDKKGLKDLKDYQIGKSKVFLRAGQMAELDAWRATVLGDAARDIQRKSRTCIARDVLISSAEGPTHLKASGRGHERDATFASYNRQNDIFRDATRRKFSSSGSSTVPSGNAFLSSEPLICLPGKDSKQPPEYFTQQSASKRSGPSTSSASGSHVQKDHEKYAAFASVNRIQPKAPSITETAKSIKEPPPQVKDGANSKKNGISKDADRKSPSLGGWRDLLRIRKCFRGQTSQNASVSSSPPTQPRESNGVLPHSHDLSAIKSTSRAHVRKEKSHDETHTEVCGRIDRFAKEVIVLLSSLIILTLAVLCKKEDLLVANV